MLPDTKYTACRHTFPFVRPVRIGTTLGRFSPPTVLLTPNLRVRLRSVELRLFPWSRRSEIDSSRRRLRRCNLRSLGSRRGSSVSTTNLPTLAPHEQLPGSIKMFALTGAERREPAADRRRREARSEDGPLECGVRRVCYADLRSLCPMAKS